MRILALIPARGGSKGVPGKNIKLLNGKPLIAYTSEIALQSNYLLVRLIKANSYTNHSIIYAKFCNIFATKDERLYFADQFQSFFASSSKILFGQLSAIA